MSFGFGIGDIIACSEVAWKTINALKSAGSDFEGLRLDLASLTSVLQALEAEAKGPMPLIKTASMERQNQMRLLLRNCTESMRDLQGVVGKYGGWNADKKRDFLMWMRFAAKDKRGPREKLAVHTASINIFLTTLSHGSLARLEFLIKNGSQGAQQTPVPDGQKGLDFSTAGAPWSGSHGHKRKEGVVWQDIGRSLQGEGITDMDIEAFQEELKAYARYLVRGETPFWKGPGSKSGAEEVERMRREQEARRRDDESKRLADEMRRRQDDKYERYQRDEDYTRAEVDRRLLQELEFRRAAESRLESQHEIRYELRSPASKSARDQEEAKKLMLREELKQARQSEYIGTAVLSELEPEMRRTKMREEEEMRRRKEDDPGMRFRTDQEDDVVSLAYTFQGLFEFDAEPTQAVPVAPDSEAETVPVLDHAVDDVKILRERERRNVRIYEIQKGLGRLLDRRDRYIDEGRRDKVADMEVNGIPDQVQRLRMEGVDVSHEKAWKWTHRCNVCRFLIPSDHYHCSKCGGGNWDACQECWNGGARCSGPGNHRIIFKGRIAV